METLHYPVRMRSKSRPTDVSLEYNTLAEAYSFIQERPELIHDISAAFVVHPQMLGLQGKPDTLIIQPKIVAKLSQSEGGVEMLELNIENRFAKAPRNFKDLHAKQEGFTGVVAPEKKCTRLIFQVGDYKKDPNYDRGLAWVDITDPNKPSLQLTIVLNSKTNADELIARHMKTQEYLAAELKSFLDEYAV